MNNISIIDYIDQKLAQLVLTAKTSDHFKIKGPCLSDTHLYEVLVTEKNMYMHGWAFTDHRNFAHWLEHDCHVDEDRVSVRIRPNRCEENCEYREPDTMGLFDVGHYTVLP